MFKLFITISLLFIVNEFKVVVSSLVEDLGCKDIASKSPVLALKRFLFCDYDPTVKPTIGVHSTLEIGIKFIPKYVEFVERFNGLDFHTWIVLSWDDVHLQWNPDDFNHIEMCHAKSDEIWVPDFSVFNSGNLGLDQTGLPSTDCIIQNNGSVQCVAGKVYTTHCPADFTDWPYDKHNCTLHFGSWMHLSNEVNFNTDSDSILMEEFVQSPEWNVNIHNLTKSSELYHNELDTMIFLSITLERRTTKNILVYISSGIILAVITLVVLWLDYNSVERVAIASTNFICHLICMYDLHWILPSNGIISAPKILIFYEISTSLAAFTLLFTSFIKKIYSIPMPPPPQWISSLTNVILNSVISKYIGIHCFLRSSSQSSSSNDVESTVNEQLSSNKQDIWKELGGILEWLGFVSVLLTYVILLGLFLPQTPPKIENYIY